MEHQRSSKIYVAACPLEGSATRDRYPPTSATTWLAAEAALNLEEETAAQKVLADRPPGRAAAESKTRGRPWAIPLCSNDGRLASASHTCGWLALPISAEMDYSD